MTRSAVGYRPARCGSAGERDDPARVDDFRVIDRRRIGALSARSADRLAGDAADEGRASTPASQFENQRARRPGCGAVGGRGGPDPLPSGWLSRKLAVSQPGKLAVSRPHRGGRCPDRGSATIWVLALAAMMMALTTAVVLRSTAVLARHRMERAADLSALAAADLIGGTGDPCAAAARVAGRNGARLVGCSIELDASGRSGTVAILLNKAIELPVIGVRTVIGRARAGRLPPPNLTHPP